MPWMLNFVWQDSIFLSRVDRSNIVAPVSCSENKDSSTLFTTWKGLPQLPQKKHRRAPHNGTTLCVSFKSILDSCSGNPYILNQDNLDILAKHVRANTRETYGPRWQWFLGFYNGKNVILFYMNKIPFLRDSSLFPHFFASIRNANRFWNNGQILMYKVSKWLY